MKKNAVLFPVFIVLAILAYYIEERGDLEKKEEREKISRIFDMKKYGKLLSFSTKKVVIEFKENGAYLKSSQRLVDQRKLNLVFDTLTKIRMQRVFNKSEINTKNRHFFFPNEDKMEFHFSKGKISYLIGKKIETSRSFYLEILKGNERVSMVAHDPSPVKYILSKNQSERDDSHYRKIRSLLTLSPDFFEDLYVFNKKEREGILNIKEIFFENRRNKSFRVDFKSTLVTPLLSAKIQVNKDKINKYLKDLIKLEGKSFKYFDQNDDYGNLLASLTVNRIEGERIGLQIFSSFSQGEKRGYFLKKGDKVFKLARQDVNLFMLNRQDFWKKSLIIPKQAVGKLSFPTKKSINFKVNADKRFSVEPVSKSYRLNNREFYKIYSFLQKKAEFISIGTPDKKGFSIQTLFDIDLGALRLTLYRTKNEIIIYDKISDIKYHYLYGEKTPFSFDPDKVVIK